MTPRIGIPCALILVVGFAATAACSRSGPDVAEATGTWAGAEAAMKVTTTGAHIEFPCAVGDIPQPLMAGSNGEFSADGVYAIQVGPANGPQQPARYTGRIDNQKMTLSVTLSATSQTFGSFTLTYGSPASFAKCL